jgi:hypothetical protein
MDLFYRRNGVVSPQSQENPFGEGLKEDPLISANVVRPPAGEGKPLFIKSDPRWVVVLKAKWIRRRHGPALFPDNTSGKTFLDSKARIVLLGDWGSGAPDAVKMAVNIWDQWLQPELGRRELHVVHLCDVYLAGLAHEYTRNFLKHWPAPVG